MNILINQVDANGYPTGEWVGHYNNGQLKNKGLYIDGCKEGEWVEYHDNGQIKIKGAYVGGREIGEFESYYFNGKPRFKGTFKTCSTYSWAVNTLTYNIRIACKEFSYEYWLKEKDRYAKEFELTNEQLEYYINEITFKT